MYRETRQTKSAKLATARVGTAAPKGQKLKATGRSEKQKTN